jgi:F1F0 ATPase subunit 2
MNDAPGLAAALAGGALLGAFYFGTLWLVVQRLDRVRWPAVWLAVTGFVRLVVVLAVFVLLVGGRWERMVAVLAGFVAVRVVLTRRLGRPVARPRPDARGET